MCIYVHIFISKMVYILASQHNNIACYFFLIYMLYNLQTNKLISLMQHLN